MFENRGNEIFIIVRLFNFIKRQKLLFDIYCSVKVTWCNFCSSFHWNETLQVVKWYTPTENLYRRNFNISQPDPCALHHWLNFRHRMRIIKLCLFSPYLIFGSFSNMVLRFKAGLPCCYLFYHSNGQCPFKWWCKNFISVLPIERNLLRIL